MTGGILSRSSLYIEQKRLFWRYFKFSVFAHIISILAMFAFAYLIPQRTNSFSPSIQVDIVELPDFVKNEKRLVDTSLPVKDEPVPKEAPPEPKQPDEMTLKEKKEKVEKVDEKKALSALEKIKQQVKQREDAEKRKLLEQRMKEAKQFDEKFRNKLGGNNLNQGNSVSGTLTNAINAYAGHVTDKIRNFWEIPPFLQNKNLRAVINLYIDANGSARYYFKLKSGDTVFDNLVKDAIDRSLPFAPPPAELVGPLKRSGMEVRFPL